MSRQREQLRRVLTEARIRKMAGGKYFGRGQEYYESDAVRSIVEHRGIVKAKVVGADTYRVQLLAHGDDLDFSCTCPLGDDGLFCKHCVAVGLAWLGKPRGKPARKAVEITMEEVSQALEAKDKKELIELLIEEASWNDTLRHRLLIQAVTGAAKQDPERLKAVIDQAVEQPAQYGDFSPRDYVRGIDEIIGTLRNNLKKGAADEALDLIEYAVEAVEHANSEYHFSDEGLNYRIEQLRQLHIQACENARPDPTKLAKRIFNWQLHREGFYHAVRDYAKLLGKAGMARFRELAVEAWDRIPPLAPGEKDSDHSTNRYRLTELMEDVAKISGGVEALVAVKKRNLSSPQNFLEVAKIYKEADRHDEALGWAERGLNAFSEEGWVTELREFTANEYHRRRRHDDAMALIWGEFDGSPRLDAYKRLKAHADRCGKWSEWRRKAIGLLDKEGRGERDGSALVEVHVWEKKNDSAWKEAKARGCSEDLWLELAGLREKDHPEEAIPIYQRRVETTLGGGKKEDYRQAVSQLRKIRQLMCRAGRGKDFSTYLESVRAEHRRKRNFTAMLDRAKW